MTVVESAAGELAAQSARAQRRIDELLVLSMVVLFQLGWLGVIAYGAYRLAT
ncbi:MAG TPA: hypothetical protein VFU56_10620 [Gaiellaceae bacterium]|nr:hypothetical protein [Gaiellaceae bacterium]